MTSQMRELAGEVLQEHIVQGRPAADSIWARGAGPLVQSWDRCKKFVTALKESISTLASASIRQVPTTGGRGSQPGPPPAVLAVADVLDVLHYLGAQSVLPHDCQHLPVHQVMRPQAVGVTTVPSREVFADVEPLARHLLTTNLSSTFSLISFAYLGHKKRVTLDQKHC